MPLILPNTIQNDIPADGDKLGQNFATITDWANQEVITRDGGVAMQSALLLPGAPTQPNQAATKAYVDGWMPVGSVVMFGGITEPERWMFCRGQAISRSTYATLFSVLSTRYGTGNGSTTFNLPNYQATIPVGFNSGTNPPTGLDGAFVSSVGERYGDRNQSNIAHTHTVSGTTGGHSATHTHNVSLTSGGQSQQHYHSGHQGNNDILNASIGAENGVLDLHDGGPSLGYIRTGTYWNNVDHTHNVSGATGNASASHTHTFSDTTSSTGSASATNYAPSLSINFIIKVS